MATMILATANVHGHTKYAQRITSAGHTLAADEPESRGGTNAGPAPFDLMLASLGACTAITLRMYADRKQWDLGDIDVQLRLIRDDGERVRIERKLSVGNDLTDDQRARLIEIADKTPVSRVLAAGVTIHTTF